MPAVIIDIILHAVPESGTVAQLKLGLL